MNLDEDRETELASMAHWAASSIVTAAIAIMIVAVLALVIDAPRDRGSPPRHYDPAIHRLDRMPV